MILIALAICAILTCVAALHFYWAAGGIWPAKSAELLAKTVIGTSGARSMPPAWLTVLVAVVIFAAGVLPLIWITLPHDILPWNTVPLAMIALLLVFTIRGIASFTPAFRTMLAEEPFATLDRKYFGPLCLGLGLGFGLLLAL